MMVMRMCCFAAFAALFLGCGLPFNVVNNLHFRVFLAIAVPGFTLLSRTSQTRRAIAMGLKIKASLRDKLSNIKYYSLTSDIWSSRANDGYISVTVHFVKDWTVKNVCIAVRGFQESHSGDNIRQIILGILREFSLDASKMVAITTDRGANMVAAICNPPSSSSQKNGEEPERFPEGCHVPCFTHMLNTGVQRAFEQATYFKSAFEELKSLVIMLLFYHYTIASQPYAFTS